MRDARLRFNYNLKIIEEAAHALPAQYQGEMVGSIGAINCFSFYITISITKMLVLSTL